MACVVKLIVTMLWCGIRWNVALWSGISTYRTQTNRSHGADVLLLPSLLDATAVPVLLLPSLVFLVYVRLRVWGFRFSFPFCLCSDLRRMAITYSCGNMVDVPLRMVCQVFVIRKPRPCLPCIGCIGNSYDRLKLREYHVLLATC